MRNVDLSQFLNKGMVLWVVPKNSILYLSQNYTIAWKEYKHNIFYLLLQIAQTHSNYTEIWATQPFVTFKTQWKNGAYENFITILRNIWLKMQSKNSFIHTKKHFLVKKCIVLLIWVYKFLSILQNSKVANNSITILGYSNDKNIYIAKNIISTG